MTKFMTIDRRTGEVTIEEVPAGKTLADLVHDCPECRAAMARGEVPITFGPEDFAAGFPRAKLRPLRWRQRKGAR